MEDRFGSASVAIARPELLCNPASVDGGAIAQPAASLLCYATRDRARSGGPSFGNPLRLKVTSRFASNTLYLFGARRLCLPTAVRQIDLEPKRR